MLCGLRIARLLALDPCSPLAPPSALLSPLSPLLYSKSHRYPVAMVAVYTPVRPPRLRTMTNLRALCLPVALPYVPASQSGPTRLTGRLASSTPTTRYQLAATGTPALMPTNITH